MGRYNPWLDRLWHTKPHACAYCLRILKRKPSRPNTATVDHIQARFNGGAYEEGNLVLACKECNEIKASHSLAQLERRLAIARKHGQPEDRRLRLIVDVLRGMEDSGPPTPGAPRAPKRGSSGTGH